jgi:hypothetical protein
MQGPAVSGTDGATAFDSQGTAPTPPPPTYPAAPPPQRELRIPIGNLPSLIRVLVICLCALGIVAALIVPWVHMEMTVGTENASASYDGKLQRMDEPAQDDGLPSDLGATLVDSGYANVGKYYDRGIAITGFILLLIIMGAAMFMRLVDVVAPRAARAAQVALIGVALLPASMATVAGMRFIGGFGIAYDSILDALHVKASISSIGGLVVAAIGLLIVILLIIELLKELSAASAAAPAAPWSWSLSLPQKVLLGVVVLAVAGIVAVPVTPWAVFHPEAGNVEDGGSGEAMGSFFLDEGLIYGSSEGATSGQDQAHDMLRDVHHVSAFFWLALVFALVGVMAMALEGLGAPKALVGGIKVASAAVFLFPLLGLLAHVAFMGHLKDMEIAVGQGDLTFAAYAPFVVALVLLLTALLYLAVASRGMRGGPRREAEATVQVGLKAAAPGAVPSGLPVVEGPFPGGSGSGGGKDDSRRGWG